VKEAERLSIEEKPQFKPASKIAFSDEAQKPSEVKNQIDGQSKKRSFDEITNTETNQVMTDETKVLPEEPKDQIQKSVSPTSSKYQTCENEEKAEKSNEKISPNSKRLKLDDTPPKKDILVTSVDGEKKDAAEEKHAKESEKQAVEEEKKDDLKDHLKAPEIEKDLKGSKEVSLGDKATEQIASSNEIQKPV